MPLIFAKRLPGIVVPRDLSLKFLTMQSLLITVNNCLCNAFSGLRLTLKITNVRRLFPRVPAWTVSITIAALAGMSCFSVYAQPVSGMPVIASNSSAPVAIKPVPLLSGPSGIQITDIDIIGDAARLPVQTRSNFLVNTHNVSADASNLYTRRILAAEAEKAGLTTDPGIVASLRIAREKVLSDARIAQIDAATVPTDRALEDLAKTQYHSDPKRFEAPEQVQLRHILIARKNSDAQAKAEKLLADLKGGADFATLATRDSDDPGSAIKGGELGFLRKGQTVPPFESAAFALVNSGDLSPVVETTFGFHIIQLEARKAPGIQPFEDIKEGLKAQILAKLAQDARNRESERLLKEVKIDESAIEAFSERFK